MITNKKVIWGILLLLLIALIVYRVFSPKKNQYTFGKVEKKTVTEIVSESGSVVTNGRVEIYSPTTGVVQKIFVSNGDKVLERQKLFTVKSTASPQEKAAANAEYQLAKAAFRQAENTRRSTMATVDRVHDDVKNHDKDETYLQKETRTIAEVANDNAYDALLAAQARLSSAQINYYATLNSTVTAPVPGLISNLSLTEGTSVQIKNILLPSSPLLLIGELGETEVVVSVGESDINKIKVGQEAVVRFDAVENKTYPGVVQRLDESGINTQGVAKFNVYLIIQDPDENLKPGMNADVDITTKELVDVLTVPNTAIKPYQKGRAVRILGKNKQIEFVTVKTGIKGKDYTQIIEGLKEGDRIITSLSGETPPKSNFFQI